MSRIGIISFIVGLLTISCKRKLPAQNAGAQLVEIFDTIPSSLGDWRINRHSFGSSGYEQTLHFSITLEGASSGEAVLELKSSIEEMLAKQGFEVITSHQSGSDERIHAFSFTVADGESVGTMAVNTAKTNSDELIAVVAIAQIAAQASK